MRRIFKFWVYHHFLYCCLGLVIGIAKTPWFACLKPKLFLAKQYAFYKFCIAEANCVKVYFLQLCDIFNVTNKIGEYQCSLHTTRMICFKKKVCTLDFHIEKMWTFLSKSQCTARYHFFQLCPYTFPFMFGRYPLIEAQVMDLIGTPSITRSNIFVRFWYSLVRTFIIWTITVAPLTQLQSLFFWEEANLTTAQHHILVY